MSDTKLNERLINLDLDMINAAKNFNLDEGAIIYIRLDKNEHGINILLKGSEQDISFAFALSMLQDENLKSVISTALQFCDGSVNPLFKKTIVKI